MPRRVGWRCQKTSLVSWFSSRWPPVMRSRATAPPSISAASGSGPAAFTAGLASLGSGAVSGLWACIWNAAVTKALPRCWWQNMAIAEVSLGCAWMTVAIWAGVTWPPRARRWTCIRPGPPPAMALGVSPLLLALVEVCAVS